MAVPFDYSQVEDPEYGFMLPPDSSDDEDIPSKSERSVSSQALSLPTKSESQSLLHLMYPIRRIL